MHGTGWTTPRAQLDVFLLDATNRRYGVLYRDGIASLYKHQEGVRARANHSVMQPIDGAVCYATVAYGHLHDNQEGVRARANHSSSAAMACLKLMYYPALPPCHSTGVSCSRVVGRVDLRRA